MSDVARQRAVVCSGVGGMAGVRAQRSGKMVARAQRGHDTTTQALFDSLKLG